VKSRRQSYIKTAGGMHAIGKTLEWGDLSEKNTEREKGGRGGKSNEGNRPSYQRKVTVATVSSRAKREDPGNRPRSGKERYEA